jgi:hypothetical protein
VFPELHRLSGKAAEQIALELQKHLGNLGAELVHALLGRLPERLARHVHRVRPGRRRVRRRLTQRMSRAVPREEAGGAAAERL